MSESYDLKMDVSKVRGANISRYSDGYNYASVSFKMSDNEYMNVSYDWKGKDIPEVAMNIMEIMKTMGKEKANTLDDEAIEALERAGKYFLDRAAKMKKKDEDEDEEEMDDESKMKKDKKDKKEKK